MLLTVIGEGLQVKAIRFRGKRIVALVLMLVLGGILQGTAFQESIKGYNANLRIRAAGFSVPSRQLDTVLSSKENHWHPLAMASVASVAEELIASPNHPDFLILRRNLTQELVNSDQFDDYPKPVMIDLSTHIQKETINYLISERPGILSVVYYTGEGKHKDMVVYWPEMIGELLLYIPINGYSSLLNWPQD